MITINNKSWDKIRKNDIIKLLSGIDDENFFFEFKSDDESPAKLIKEISAFANTYGGYILLGINDDKTISGCKKWNEQRIHVTVHDTITPIPNFAVKKIKINDKNIFVIKIEEGQIPPYITNKGAIYERVSSGSFPITNSSKLDQLYQKRKDQISLIKNKIEPLEVKLCESFPSNIYGYFDLGFSLTSSKVPNPLSVDIDSISEYLKSICPSYSISRVGYNYYISFGEITSSHNETEMPILAGIHNYIEIISDGSVHSRVMLTNMDNSNYVDVSYLSYLYINVFPKIYTMFFMDKIDKSFISAHKYEKITVIKQFIPIYTCDKEYSSRLLNNHIDKFGNNIIIESSRIPINGYTLVDKQYFNYWSVIL